MKLRNFSPWSQVSDERAGEVGPLSGIAGIFNRSGQSVDLTAVSLLLSSSAHRSSNGVAEFCESQVGLVQRISIPPDPESAHARGELEHLHGHRVTFHGHLTNKSSLRGRLGSEVGRCLNDASLVLEAYLKWGHDCAVHLEGDFAFAIWDRKDRVLFCTRDVLGIKPFHYYLDENLFIFGSEVDDILCHTGVSTELDTEFIA